MSKITTLHIPIEQRVRQRLTAKAKRLGFDSLQAYIRVWAKAQADERQLHFGEPEQMTPKLERLIAKVEREVERGEVSGPFTTAEDFLAALKK